MPNVKSTDPRKKSIVAAILKAAGKGSKVTNVKETKTHFKGDVLVYCPSVNHRRGTFENLGTFSVPKADGE
jgi:hypothetical protein